MIHTFEESEKTLRVYLYSVRGIKLDVIDATIKAAREGGEIAPELVQRAEDARRHCLTLLDSAWGKGSDSLEFARVMDAGQTLFEIADRLHGLMLLRPEVARDRSTQAGRAKGGSTLAKRNAAAAQQAEQNRNVIQARYRQLMSEKNGDDKTAKARTNSQLFREFPHLSESAIRRALSSPKKQAKSKLKS